MWIIIRIHHFSLALRSSSTIRGFKRYVGPICRDSKRWPYRLLSYLLNEDRGRCCQKIVERVLSSRNGATEILVPNLLRETPNVLLPLWYSGSWRSQMPQALWRGIYWFERGFAIWSWLRASLSRSSEESGRMPLRVIASNPNQTQAKLSFGA